MLTYQDLQNVGDSDKARLDFVRKAMAEHEASDLYRMAKTANSYMCGQNETIVNYQKTLVTHTGRTVLDKWSPNHKTVSNFFNRFVTQQTQYLLGNGVTWQDEKTAEKLGIDFDLRLQDEAQAALVGSIAFGFWNVDHLEVFPVAGSAADPTYFKPLYDENTGAIRAGIRYWQIDSTKPLRATLYEEDGFTEMGWKMMQADGKRDEEGRILQEKRAYKLNISKTDADGIEIMQGENYPTLPIVPMYGNKLHQSELVGLREKIDAFDLIQNGYVNDLDTAQIYWIIKGAGGSDNEDLVRFLDQLRSMHAANLDEVTDAQPVTVDIPYAARETLLARLERQLYKDYKALDPDAIAGGAVTATQIKAAYEPMETKSCEFEACVLDFLYGILRLAGIEGEKPSFTRTRIVNTSEEIQNVLSAAQVLTEDYVTRKVLTLLGDGDKADEIIKQKEADEVERMRMAMAISGGELNGSGALDNGADNQGNGNPDSSGVQES